MNEFYYRLGDDLPVLQAEFSNSTGYINLTDASGVYFIMKPRYSGDATRFQGTFVNKPNGKVQYAFQPNDIPSVNSYFYTWRVYFTGNKTISFPSDSMGGSFEIISGLL